MFQEFHWYRVYSSNNSTLFTGAIHEFRIFERAHLWHIIQPLPLIWSVASFVLGEVFTCMQILTFYHVVMPSRSIPATPSVSPGMLG